MKNSTDFAKNVSMFLTEYLPFQRNYSKNTILSYRDTLKLFVRFIHEEKSYSINNFKMNNFKRPLVIEFLEYERNNGVSISTANQRLAAIKSFSNYCQINSIENIYNLQEIQMIKSTKASNNKEIAYLSVEKMKILINYPDTHTVNGIKHKLVLCLLYDTAARVQEICDLKISDLQLNGSPTIKLTGKGSKTRIIPISDNLKNLIQIYIDKTGHINHQNDSNLILNKNNSKISRDGIEYIVNKYASLINENDVTFPKKINPHMFRHSRSMHMVAANVPIIYIRDFLGHSDISTTMIYARADTKAKEVAINKLAPKIIENSDDFPDWSKDQNLLDFLNNLK